MWRNRAAALTHTVQQIWPDIITSSRWWRGEWTWHPSLSVFSCESPPFPVLSLPFALYCCNTPSSYNPVLLDLPYHATVVLSEASCSLGSENIAWWGWGGHAIPRQCHGKERAPRLWCHLVLFFCGEWRSWAAGRAWSSPRVCMSYLKSSCCRTLCGHFDTIDSVNSYV